MTVDGGFVPGRFPIDAFGAGGFRFAGMSHRGSILALPSGIHAWPPRAPSDITPAALDPAVAEAAQIDLLLIGTGAQLLPIGPRLRQRLGEAGLRADVMSTGVAASTYNVLLAEDRRVAAALLAVD